MKRIRETIKCCLMALSLLFFVVAHSWSQPYRVTKDDSSRSYYNNLSSKIRAKVNASKDVYGWCLYDSQMPGYMGLIKFNTSNLSEISKVNASSQYPICAGCFVDEDLDGVGEYYTFGLSDGGGGMQPSLINMNRVDLETGISTQITTYDNVFGMFNDADYDYSTGKMYTVSGSGERAMIFSIDLSTGFITEEATIPAPINTMSITLDGDMYGIGLDANLYKINTNVWTVEKIGSTGVYPMSLQSMTFDHTDNTLYWAFFNNGIGKLLMVDINTAVTTNLGNIGGNTEISGLYIPFTVTRQQPRKVTDFVITPKPNGEEKATLSWVNPSKNIDDSNIEILSKIEVYRDEELIHTISNPTIGGSVTWEDVSVESGIHTYKVIAYSDLKGMAAIKSIFIGRDVPNVVDNLTLVNEENIAKLNWSKNNTGYNGGWVDASSIQYRVIRMPENIVLGEVSEESFIDNSITKMNLYTYIVESFNVDGVGGRAVSNSVVIGPSFELPCTFNFSTIEDFLIWTVKDDNGDNKTWGWNNWLMAASCQGGGMSMTNDDWLISPPIKLESSKKYRISYGLSGMPIISPEKLKVMIGRGADVSSQTTVLADHDNISNFDVINYIHYFEPTENGEYNLSFYSYTTNGYTVNVSSVDIREYYDHDLVALEVKGTNMPVVNFEYEYSFSYKNIGINTENDYKIELINEDGDVLKTITEISPIDANITNTIYFKWTPLSVDDAKELRCRIVMSRDANDNNNVSTSFDVSIQPEGSADYIEIGIGNISTGAPIALSYIYSGSQTLYLREEMGDMVGLIEKISYDVAYSKGVNGVDIEVYMANSDLRTLQKTGSLPKEIFTLVYDGELIMPQTDVPTKWEIELENDFLYLGESLVVMVAAKSTNLFELEFFTYDDFVIDPFRTCLYFSNDMPFDYESDAVYLFNPQINIHLQRNGGATIEGVVKDNESAFIEDVNVLIAKNGAKAKTDEFGNYSFPYLLLDSYDLLFSKFGYVSKTVENVSLTEDNKEKIIDVQLNKILQYDIVGKCMNMNNELIANANVKIKGYANYEAVTDDSGLFNIDGVFAVEDQYEIEIIAMGYLTYKGFITVDDDDLTLDFKLSEVPYCPSPIIVNIVNDNSIELEWNGIEKITTLKHDDGIVSGQIGAQADAKTVIGTTFRVPTVVHKLSWFITSEGGPHEKVNLFIFDLDENGVPTNNIIASIENVNNIDNAWSSYTFEVPVDCPNGFLFGMSYDGFISIALDSGSDFFDDTHYTCWNYDFMKFEKFDPTQFSQNPMLRVDGMIVGSPIELTNTKSVDKIQSKEPKTFNMSYCVPFNANQIINDDNDKSRSLVGYKVWRFLEKDIDNLQEWILLTPDAISESKYTDNLWGGLENGEYRYGVRAIYSGGVESNFTISNMIGRNMNANVVINVNTNTPANESEGAVVLLTNQNGQEQYVYTGEINENGTLSIENVWKGTYDLNIYLDGFDALNIRDININEDINIFDYTMNEIVVKPYNLAVEIIDNEDNNSYMGLFSWNNFYEIKDDFEGHPDFKINSNGDLGWNYIDGDNSKTAIMGPATFPNVGERMAAIVFNPNNTTPELDMREIQPRSGDKYLGVFAALEAVNNDWIISPELNFETDFVIEFYAKSLTDLYGMEKIKVAYSTTGLRQDDFVNWVNNGEVIEVPANGWTKFSYSMPANAKYVAINCVSNDAFLLMIDDISMGIKNSSNKKFVTYNVYMDGIKQGETSDTEFLFNSVSLGKHKAGVKAIYTSGETEIVEIDFLVPVSVENCNNIDIVIYPNPIKDYLNIKGVYNSLEIYDASGKCLVSYDYFVDKIDMSSFEAGCYVVKIYIDDNMVSYKIVK